MKTNWINYFLVLNFGLLALSCKEQTKATDKTEETTDIELIENTESTETIEDEEPEDPILLGKIKPSQISATPYDRWYTTSHKDHSLDKATLKNIADKLNNASITIFMGTWCEDSQREIPALFKILTAADYDLDKVTLIAVSEEKDTPEGLEKGKSIDFVPTIIISDGENELGRIVEYPIESLEKDLAKILNGEPYKHAYEE